MRRLKLEAVLAQALTLVVLFGCDTGDAQGEGDGDETAEDGGGDGDGDGDGDGGDGGGDGDGDGDGDGGDGDGDGDGDPGPAGVFVAVGDGGRRAFSNDGVEWTEMIGTGTIDSEAEMGEEDVLRAIAAGDGVVVAVGGGGNYHNSNTMVMRSTDGDSWEEDLVGGQEDVDGHKLNAIGFSDGVFVAAGHRTHIIRSADGGETWTRPYPEHHGDTHVLGIAGSGGTFVLVGSHKDSYDAPLVSYVHISTDGGENFGAPAYFGDDGDSLRSVATDGEVYVAVGPNRCLRSADGGSNWDACGLSAQEQFGGVSYTNGRFVVTYDDGVSTSMDGESWSPHVVSMTGVPYEVHYGNGSYAGVRFYDRGLSSALDEWSFTTHGGFPLRDLAFLPLE